MALAQDLFSREIPAQALQVEIDIIWWYQTLTGLGH
jgi:hypothetical protein